MSRWIDFATIGRPHGVKGEVTLWPENPESDNVKALKEVIIAPPTAAGNSGGESCQVLAVKKVGTHYAASLAGVTSREAAALLTGKHLWADLDSLSPCGEDEFYLNDIMGFLLKDSTTGQTIGPISAIADYPQGPYLVVQKAAAGGEIEIPWQVAYLVEISFEKHEVVLALPEGFNELL